MRRYWMDTESIYNNGTTTAAYKGWLHYSDDLRYTKPYREYVLRSVHTSATICPPHPITRSNHHSLQHRNLRLALTARTCLHRSVVLDTRHCCHIHCSDGYGRVRYNIVAMFGPRPSLQWLKATDVGFQPTVGRYLARLHVRSCH